MITAKNHEIAPGLHGSFIEYKLALVGAIYCEQTIEEIEELIKNAKN